MGWVRVNTEVPKDWTIADWDAWATNGWAYVDEWAGDWTFVADDADIMSRSVAFVGRASVYTEVSKDWAIADWNTGATNSWANFDGRWTSVGDDADIISRGMATVIVGKACFYTGSFMDRSGVFVTWTWVVNNVDIMI